MKEPLTALHFSKTSKRLLHSAEFLTALLSLGVVLTNSPAGVHTAQAATTTTTSSGYKTLSTAIAINKIFPDKNLAQAVAYQLSDQLGDDVTVTDKVTQSDLNSIVEIDTDSDDDSVSYGKVSDLTGIQYLKNLEDIFFEDNNISSLAPLTGMTNLDTLDFGGFDDSGKSNNISDITPLASLKNLVDLELPGNYIKDTTPLASLTKLQTLYLDDNPITSISSVSKMTGLTDFSAEDDNLTDISALTNLKQLDYLDLAGNKISNVSPLKGLTDLEDLYLDHNNISDVSALSSLTNLTDLDLDHNAISNISPLKNLKALGTDIIDVDDGFTTLDLSSQTVTLPTQTITWPLKISNSIKNNASSLIAPSKISDSGSYTSPSLTWSYLPNTQTSVSYNFSQKVKIGSASSTFSGTVKQPLTAATTDTTAPRISGAGATTIVATQKFNPLSGVTAKDNFDGNVTSNIKVISNNLPADNAKTGTYTVQYSVTDKAGNTATVTRKVTIKDPSIYYDTQVQNIGWQVKNNAVSNYLNWYKDGKEAGTNGKALRMETIKIKLSNGVSGSVEYDAHVQRIGWQNATTPNTRTSSPQTIKPESQWFKDGAQAGTVGKGLRMEAFTVKLTGDISKYYNVVYDSHVQNIGWQYSNHSLTWKSKTPETVAPISSWFKNGAEVGTNGKSLRMEALEIKLVRK